MPLIPDDLNKATEEELIEAAVDRMVASKFAKMVSGDYIGVVTALDALQENVPAERLPYLLAGLFVEAVERGILKPTLMIEQSSENPSDRWEVKGPVRPGEHGGWEVWFSSGKNIYAEMVVQETDD